MSPAQVFVEVQRAMDGLSTEGGEKPRAPACQWTAFSRAPASWQLDSLLPLAMQHL